MARPGGLIARAPGTRAGEDRAGRGTPGPAAARAGHDGTTICVPADFTDLATHPPLRPPPRALSSRALWTPGPFLRRAPPARPRQHLYRTLTPRLTFCSENRDRLASVSLSARARP